MNRTSKQSFARLAIAAALAVGLSGSAAAQQGMPTATESELNATWIEGASGQGQSSAAASQSSRVTVGNAFTAERVYGFPGDLQAGSAASEAGADLNPGTNSRVPADASINWPL